MDGELLALALATSAAADVEAEDYKSAQAKLKSAVAAARQDSPVLAATLLSQLADIGAVTPGHSPALVVQDYQEAIRLAGDCKLPMLLPELHTKMGMILQNASNGQRGALLQAVNSYQTALQSGIDETEHPELFAQLQNNLGLAYLSMPAMGASNQLRNGIAVQSFRHALKIYTVEKHPDMWASVSMNLANALQYAPSSHPKENLIQAVETYEEISAGPHSCQGPCRLRSGVTESSQCSGSSGNVQACFGETGRGLQAFSLVRPNRTGKHST